MPAQINESEHGSRRSLPRSASNHELTNPSGTVETDLLARRRPVLALVLAAGRPAVSQICSFGNRGPEDMLRKDDNNFKAKASKFTNQMATIVVIL